jgi:signal transduction histidine kinase
MRSRLVWLSVWAGYTLLALFLAVTSSLTYVSMGNPARWSLSIGRALVEWWAWAALTPAILWLARRYPLRQRDWPASLAVHAAAAIVIGFFKLAADQQLLRLAVGVRGYLLLSGFAFNLLFYFAIVAAAHGVGYYRASRERELQASHLEARLAETRLQLLQMQLQPHFLFNTLNAISELVHEDPETADRMIGGLSELLRETLDAGSGPDVALAREVELLERYLAIQKVRFGDRLQVSIRVHEASRAARVPMLLLQPIVENSIRHGIGSRAHAGRIDIASRRDGDTLVVEVHDDGIGLPEEGTGLREGLGLANTRARLQEFFGPAHRLDVMNAEDGGVTVRLTMPYRERGAA